MASKKQNLKNSVKSEQCVGLDQRESLTRKEIEERYPICKEAQRVIDVLGKGSDKSSLYHLTEAFRGFSCEMQIRMADFLITEYYSRLQGEENTSYTGVFHVDRLLTELVYLLDHDTKNIDYNVG